MRQGVQDKDAIRPFEVAASTCAAAYDALAVTFHLFIETVLQGYRGGVMKSLQMFLAAAFVSQFAVCTAAFAASDGSKQKWPDRPVRIIVPFAAGGGTDVLARVFAAQLSAAFGQQFFVENRVGAGGTIGAEAVAHAAPDGYTLLFVSASFAASSNPDLYRLGFDPINGIAPIAQVAVIPLVLVTNPSVPANNVGELIKVAHTKPGALAYGSAGIGGTLHLATELFRQMTKTEMVHVPYKGSSLAITDLLGSQIQLMFSDLTPVLPFIRDGRVRGMGVTSKMRRPVAPDLPSISEYVPGYEVNSWFGMMATGGTPKEVVSALSEALERILNRPDMQTRLRAEGSDPAYANPEAFGQIIKRDIDLWSGVVKAAQIKVN
jgi:tripartite-type tricarboxylate transporter receptor subunit TctC